MKSFFLSGLVCIIIFLFTGWGGTGHRIINKNITISFPASMHFPAYWSDTLTAHASDADNRKGSDPTESTRHYIDIDNYPEFISNGRMIEDYDSLVTVYGSNYVISQGIVPYAIIRWVDSLKRTFQQRNFSKAILLASDIGHYVADAHQPLHITKNYDGQFSGQSGVHSRYESNLIGKYSVEIVYSNDTALYVPNVSNYVFSFIYSNYRYLDSVLFADSLAKAVTGSNSSNAYLAKYWELSGKYTTMLMKNASRAIANLIYTAWVNAGRPDPNPTGSIDDGSNIPSYILHQNYPNPFNPNTVITYTLREESNVKITIYNVLGEIVKELFSEVKKPGQYEAKFNASYLSSGIYFYSLSCNTLDGKNNFKDTKKMILLL